MTKPRAHWAKRRRSGIAGIVNDPIIYDRFAGGKIVATVSQRGTGWEGYIVASGDRCGPYGEVEVAKQSIIKRMEKGSATMNKSSRDNAGVAWARVDAVKAGDRLQADDGFDCGINSQVLTVVADEDGLLFVPCNEGRHDLSGQIDATPEGEVYTGFYLVKP